MESYDFILSLAIIMLSTKLMGLATQKFRMPQVVGALLAGLILGPAILGVLHESDFIDLTAEIGVIVLMFSAGLETDIDELKRSGAKSFLIALVGVIVPLIGGFAVAKIFNRPEIIQSDASGSIFLQNMFMGIILTATSVSITVETLREMGKIKTNSGNAILGAAIIDDILGIIALTIITSMADASVNLFTVLLKVGLFFVFIMVAGLAFHRLYKRWCESAEKGLHRHAVIAFAFCLLLAYISEQWFGVADITGAFFAGLIVSKTQRTQFLASKFDVMSYMYLSPIFFASIGLKVELPNMTGAVIMFAIVLVVVAVITKVVGCGISAKMCHYTTAESMRIGIGMISRGEVALIVASKGAQVGLMGSTFMGPVVLVVVITTIITPILLKSAYHVGPFNPAVVESGFSKNYDEVRSLRLGEPIDK